ncbi:MAG: hypothetical protein JSR33_11135 [Proteobacteria bacterium]|nr:hypothetical protein [Pseudomonadota bacterium]
MVVAQHHLEVISEFKLFSGQPVEDIRTLTGKMECLINLPVAEVIKRNLPQICAAIEKRYADCRMSIEATVKAKQSAIPGYIRYK